MGWSKEELGEIISKHPLRSAAVMSFIVAGTTSLVVGNSGITTNGVVANGTVSIEPAGEATGFDASPLGILDGAVLPTPVVTAGSLNVLESAWDIDDKTARTIGWRLRPEGAAGDSSNAPTTKLLIQSTPDNTTWTTRATLDMGPALTLVRNAIGTTSPNGLVLANETAATAGATRQYSPMMVLRSSAWDTDGSALPIYWGVQATNASSTSPTGYFAVMSSTDGTTYTSRFYGDSTGGFAVTGDLAVNGEDITCDSASAATVFNTNATSVAIGGAGDVLMSGGSGSTGCTCEGSTGDLAISGDIEAAGGYISYLGQALLSDIPASSFKEYNWYVPRAGSWRGFTVAITGAVPTAGTITCKPYIGATPVSGHDLTFTSADAAWTQKTADIAKDDHAFTAAAVKILCSGSADLSPSTLDLNVAGVIEL